MTTCLNILHTLDRRAGDDGATIPLAICGVFDVLPKHLAAVPWSPIVRHGLVIALAIDNKLPSASVDVVLKQSMHILFGMLQLDADPETLVFLVGDHATKVACFGNSAPLCKAHHSKPVGGPAGPLGVVDPSRWLILKAQLALLGFVPRGGLCSEHNCCVTVVVVGARTPW